MKENVLDVLMYLFETYIETYEDEPDPDRGALREELEKAGFHDREIDKALKWLDDLSASQNNPDRQPPQERTIRVFSDVECRRMDAESRGYLMYLENTGILSPEQRELVIDRLMALGTEDIDVERIKWVVLMVLFSQPDQEAAYARMEDLVFDDQDGGTH